MANSDLTFSTISDADAFDSPDVEAALVSYGTSDMTRAAVHLLRRFEPTVPITVVDNASPDDTAERLRADARTLAPFRLSHGINRHHGPAMDAAMHATSARWLLTLDTDTFVWRSGLIRAMIDRARESNAWAVGHLLHVDGDGFNADAPSGTPYVHPHCALLDVATYRTLEPFEKHGAPFVRTMESAQALGLTAADFSVAEYAHHVGKGTVNQHGYGLGARSRLAQIMRRLRGRR